MSRNIRIGLLAFIVLTAVGALFLYQKYVAGPTVPKGLEDYTLIVPTGVGFETVVDSLTEKGLLEDEQVFRFFADQMAYVRNPMRAGRFELEPGWDMIHLVRHLRNGPQAPVNVVLTNERLPKNVAAKVSRFIEPDSVDLLSAMQDRTTLQELGFEPATLMSLFIPNTYEFFWNTGPQVFLERMRKEHKRFWSSEQRTAKAEALGLSPAEVYTLASIVEKETLVGTEKARIAGVYLNRLEIGMRLQADPTAVFARRDFGTLRVTDYHTKYDSPYNTYRYAGLPPGPIAMASISSIDAVLEAEQHDYLYFCAKGDGSGQHAFARNLAAHNRNAAIYRRNLRERGLR